MLPTSQCDRDIEILLATHNGANFLERQLESLLEQTCQEFRITVRDDCSTDGTVAILARYAERFPEKLRYGINRKRLGALGNFAALLADSTASYVLLCDQDDVWLPEKIAQTRQVLRKAESFHGSQTPILVHSDAVLVDANLRVISSSFWRSCKVRPKRARLRNLLAQNLVTGCTVGCNRALLERALPVPVDEAVMHDYWLALVASSFGVVVPLQEPTVLYRQHGGNTVGMRQPMTLSQTLRRIIRDPQLQAKLTAAIRQANAFSRRFSSELSRSQHAELMAFQSLFENGYLLRRWLIVRHGLLRTGFWNNIGYLARV
jgi:glycosyltransferase involved in cell wall biosynthesis